MPNEIDILRNKSKRVAGEHRVFTAAQQREREVEAQLLGEVREIVREALPAIVSKIVGQPMRGVQVARGGLYLCEDGNWWLFQNSFSMTQMTDQGVVENGFSVVQVVQQLDVVLSAQLTGGKAEVEERITERATRIHSILALLRK